MTFPEPKTLEEAQERREALGVKSQAIQRQLGRHIRNHELRQKILQEKLLVDSEISFLRKWLKDYHRNFRSTVMQEFGEQDSIERVVGDAVSSFFRLKDVVQAQKLEIVQLQSENAALRARVAELDMVEVVAPNSGRDIWRDAPVQIR